MGGRNLPFLIEIGVTYLKIYIGSCLACLTIGYAPEVAVKDPKTMVRINNKPTEWFHQIKYLSLSFLYFSLVGLIALMSLAQNGFNQFRFKKFK